MSGAWCPCWDESVGSWGPSHLPAEVSAHRDGWGRGGALVSWNHFLDTQQWQCIVSSPPDVSLSVQRASRNLGEDTNQPGSFDEAPGTQCWTKDSDFYVMPGRWRMGPGCLHVFPHSASQSPVPWGTISLPFNSCIVYYQVSPCQPHILHARGAYCCMDETQGQIAHLDEADKCWRGMSKRAGERSRRTVGSEKDSGGSDTLLPTLILTCGQEKLSSRSKGTD